MVEGGDELACEVCVGGGVFVRSASWAWKRLGRGRRTVADLLEVLVHANQVLQVSDVVAQA